MLLVSFDWTIKSAFHLPRAMLCFAFLAKKLSVAPHYLQNSSFRHWTPSMMLTQSPFPVFGCIPSNVDYSIFRECALDFSPDIFVHVIEQITFPCSVHNTHLCWVATSLLKCISHAIDFVKPFLSRRCKNKAPGLRKLAFWLRMGIQTLSKKIKFKNT